MSSPVPLLRQRHILELRRISRAPTSLFIRRDPESRPHGLQRPSFLLRLELTDLPSFLLLLPSSPRHPSEILDFGYPQNSEIDTLKMYITTEGVKSELSVVRVLPSFNSVDRPATPSSLFLLLIPSSSSFWADSSFLVFGAGTERGLVKDHHSSYWKHLVAEIGRQVQEERGFRRRD